MNLEADNTRLERATPEERLRFALDRFGSDLLFTSSFGAQSAVLLHLWSVVARERPVIFLDTGFHFDETLRYRDAIAKRLHLNVEIVAPMQTTADFIVEHGADIQLRDPDFCCARNKVEPLAGHKARARGWVSGLRRDQAKTRTHLHVLEADGHLVKVHPIVTLTASDVRDYMRVHDLPEHPLVAKRFLSIGCAPCTRAVGEGEDERAGRWAFSGKTECGLHKAS